MKTRQLIAMVVLAVVSAGWAHAQSSSGPAPAYGQGAEAGQSNPNPPISGLDAPTLEPGAAPRSFLIPGAHISEALDTNPNGATDGQSPASVTTLLGSMALQRLWSRYDFALDYVGGGSFYSSGGPSASQIENLEADQRVLWKNGQLAIRDAFSYLPEGSFGFGSYGGAGSIAGIGTLGGPLSGGGFSGGGIGVTQNDFFGPGQFASIGQEPVITNLAVADVTQDLSSRSALTFAGSYGVVHYTNDNTSFFDSRQVGAQAGYNYKLNRKDQIALTYGYQAFRYPDSDNGNFDTHVINFLYGHRVSGRLDFLVGGGPQITQTSSPFFGSTNTVSLSGRASVRYRFPKTSVGVYYDHYNTAGSGFFVGAKTDVVRFSASRPFARVWDASADVGYTHDVRIIPVLAILSPVNNANSYNYVYAGGALHRQLGRQFSAFFSYQFNQLGFDQSFCGVALGCQRTSDRHIVAVGLDWHPHPIRLD